MSGRRERILDQQDPRIMAMLTEADLHRSFA